MIIAFQGPSQNELRNALGTRQQLTFGTSGAAKLSGTIELLYDASGCDMPIFFPHVTGPDGENVWVVIGSTTTKRAIDPEADEPRFVEEDVNYIALVQFTPAGAFKMGMLVAELDDAHCHAFLGTHLMATFNKVAELWFAASNV